MLILFRYHSLILLKTHNCKAFFTLQTCLQRSRVQGPPEWHPAPSEVKAAAKKAAQLASGKGVDIVKLAIMDAVRQEGIATTLIGFCTPEQVRSSLPPAKFIGNSW